MSLSDTFKKAASAPRLDELSLPDIAYAIKRLMLLFGMPEKYMPSQDRFDDLKVEFQRYLRVYTAEQIFHAVDLVTSGAIDYELNLFNRPFNVIHIAGLMQKYKAYKKAEAPKVAQQVIEKKTNSEIAEINALHRENLFRDYLAYIHDRKIPEYFIPHVVINTLADCGLIDKKVTPSAKALSLALSVFTQNKNISKGEKRESLAKYKTGIVHPRLQSEINRTASMEIIIAVFDKIKAGKIDFKALLDGLAFKSV